MTSNVHIDQDKLISDTDENNSTLLRNTTDLGTDSYGTFIGKNEAVQPATTAATSYPYAFGSQQPTVIILGGCPACKTGMLETDFTCLGLCCAIFLFPVGIICCLAMRQRRCQNCGIIFD